jgi:hypothetical protein
LKGQRFNFVCGGGKDRITDDEFLGFFSRVAVVAVIDRLDERIDFSRVCSSITCATRSGVRAIRLAADSLVAPHHFEKPE